MYEWIQKQIKGNAAKSKGKAEAQTLPKRQHIPNASANANETPAQMRRKREHKCRHKRKQKKKHKGEYKCERKGFNVNADVYKNAEANEKASASAK